MYNDGSVSNNIRYPEICNINTVVVNIVYVNTGFFEVVNDTMVEWYDYWGLKNEDSRIPYDFEIMKTFIQNNKIALINWRDCNGTYGIFDHDTGNWTGQVGQVNNYYKYKFTYREEKYVDM